MNTSSESQLENRLLKLTLAAGLLLIPLLPIGIWLGPSTLLYRLVFIAELLALVAAAVASLWGFVRLCSGMWRALLIPVTAITLVMLSLEYFLPITARDALIHHLAVAKLWIAAGKIGEIPWHSWSYYPELIQLGYTGLLSLGLDRLTPIYHGLFLWILAGLTANLLRRMGANNTLAAIGFVFTLTLPIHFRLAGTPLVDLPLAAFFIAALISLTKVTELKADRMSLILSGAFLGLAVSTKYNGLLASAVFAPAAIIFLCRKGLKLSSAIGALLVIGFSALVVYAPWLIRNGAYTGNPFFPLFQSWFSVAPQTPGSSLSPLAQRLLQYNESIADYFLLPFRMLTLGQDDNPQYFDGVLSPFLLLAIFPIVRYWKKNPTVALVGLVSLSYAVFAVLLTGPRVRYLIPVTAPLLALSVLGIPVLADLFGKRSPKQELALTLLVVLSYLAFGLSYATELSFNSNSMKYLSGSISRSQYIETKVPEYPVIEEMNRILGPGSKTQLILTGNNFYLYDTPVESYGYLSAAPLIQAVKDAATPDELAQWFVAQDITHFLAHAPRLVELFVSDLDHDKQVLWDAFVLSHLQEIKIEGPYVLWQVDP